ncbi:IS110 family transposase [Arthrobacter globiformis]|uniref:IS110 family transposase n=1 Tax=Arthrobacter globiformis TaxID=1665 RepID=UPI00358EB965
MDQKPRHRPVARPAGSPLIRSFIPVRKERFQHDNPDRRCHGRWWSRHSPATSPGYEALRLWMRGYGSLASIGVESTGSFGAALARELTRQGEQVIEVNRPNRIARRMDGKSDRLDAEQIARAVLGETSTATPKSKSGTIEVIRTLRVTRSSAVKARTQAFNTLFGIMIGGALPQRYATSW